MKNFIRIFAVLLTLTIAPWLSTSSASAHASLEGSNPAKGAKLESLPASVEVSFNESLGQPGFLSVIGPDGKEISTGNVDVAGPKVTRAVTDPGQAGVYTINYRVISGDGHPVTGSIEFEVTSGATVEKTITESTDSDDDGTSTLTYVIIGIAVLAIVATALATVAARRKNN